MPDSRQKSVPEFTRFMNQNVLKGQDQLDTEAILIAQQALTKIDSHEAICAKRWSQAVALLRASVGGIGLILISIIGYLINFILTLPHH